VGTEQQKTVTKWWPTPTRTVPNSSTICIYDNLIKRDNLLFISYLEMKKKMAN